MKTPTLVQFGAGGIGRSLVGQLFSAAGWRVIFLDVADDVVNALNARGRYRIVVKDDLPPGQPGTIDVENVSAIHLRDREKAVEAVREADMAGTSVGAANIPAVCEIIASALAGRGRDLSVMLCENLHNASGLARECLKKSLPPDSLLPETVGFVESAISKMAPPLPPELRKTDPLTVYAEAYNTLYLDRDACKGPPPAIFGVAWRSDFGAYVDRKLLLHNFAHAATAYAGFLKNKQCIADCMDDPEIREQTAGCMLETARALAIRHKSVFTFDENKAWADDLLRRFANRALGDPVDRVGRDLMRKLAPDDRCVGALRLLMETGQSSIHTAKAIAAALLFAPEGSPPGDEDVVKTARANGPESVLTTLCGLDASRDAEAIAAIATEYRRLSAAHP